MKLFSAALDREIANDNTNKLLRLAFVLHVPFQIHLLLESAATLDTLVDLLLLVRLAGAIKLWF